MIKNDDFAIYQGQEYRIIKIDNHFELISKDKRDLQKGFVPYERNPEILIKVVEKSELETAYHITTSVLYKGRKFGIAAGDGSTDPIIIGTTYKSEADELGMKNVNKSEYEMSVDLKDVELIEEKKSIWGFTLDKEN